CVRFRSTCERPGHACPPAECVSTERPPSSVPRATLAADLRTSLIPERSGGAREERGQEGRHEERGRVVPRRGRRRRAEARTALAAGQAEEDAPIRAIPAAVRSWSTELSAPEAAPACRTALREYGTRRSGRHVGGRRSRVPGEDRPLHTVKHRFKQRHA